jgi:signal transduction histidine kinase
VRNISHNLIPEILNFGLVKAIDALADRINSTEKVKVDFSADDNLQKLTLSKQTELSLYRIVQEILSNIVRHSNTDRILIEMKHENAFVQLLIRDNGKGFDSAAIDESKGLGWKNIFARIKLINGEIKIQSEKNKGSNFFINIPIA